MATPVRKPIIKSDHALVPLTKGYFAIIDLCDVERVCKHNWQALVKTNTVYASRKRRVNEDYPNSNIRMHNFILGIIPSDLIICDHRDRNGLNNRRSNLRKATHRINNHNRCGNFKGTSKYKGVHLDSNSGKYRALIEVKGSNVWLHRGTEKACARAYDMGALKYFGKHAYLNFPHKRKIYLQILKKEETC